MRSRPKVFPSSICCRPFDDATNILRQRGWRAASINATSSGLHTDPGLLLFTNDLPVVSFTSDGSALTPLKGGPSDSHKGVSSQNCSAQMSSGLPPLHSLEGLQTTRRILP